MEAQLVCDRSLLRDLMKKHPEWTNNQYAHVTGYSVGWVKKWKMRLGQAPADDMQILFSRSRAHHAPYHRWSREVITRLGEMREHPPEGLRRIPGPKALAYFLKRDPALQALGVAIPRSSRTIWKLLRQEGYIMAHTKPQHQPLLPREPLEEVQVDFKDVTTAFSDGSGEGKKQHHVEVCNFVDAGTSILLSAQAHASFQEQSAFEAIVTFLRAYGRPSMITLDRDPRWVGSSRGRDFPSPLVRFLTTLSIEPHICPPHRPDKNAYVERYNKTYKYECILVDHPGTVEEVQNVTDTFLHHYNEERPHQARSCRNQPPRVAYPCLPTLPSLPDQVQPNSWLRSLHHKLFPRLVGADGCVTVDLHTYYVSPRLAGQFVALQVDADLGCFHVWQGATLVKELPIKGLFQDATLPFEVYVQIMLKEALAQARRVSHVPHTIHTTDGTSSSHVTDKPSAFSQQSLWT
jgi:transposase InsO family protein